MKTALTGIWGNIQSGLNLLCELGKLAKGIDKWGLGIGQCRTNTTRLLYDI